VSASRYTATCPGFGQNLQDHYIARISHAVQGVTTVNERSHGMALAVQVLRHLVTGKGILTCSALLDAATVKGAGEIGNPRRAVQHRSGSFKDGRIGAPAGMSGEPKRVVGIRCCAIVGSPEATLSATLGGERGALPGKP
jgi:hypothetical protein